MEKKDFYLEEEEVIVAPYYYIFYIDDYGYKHIATVKDEEYAKYLKERYTIIEYKFIEA